MASKAIAKQTDKRIVDWNVWEMVLTLSSNGNAKLDSSHSMWTNKVFFGKWWCEIMYLITSVFPVKYASSYRRVLDRPNEYWHIN